MLSKFPHLFFTGPRINLAKLPKSHRDGHQANGVVAAGRNGGRGRPAAPNAPPIWTSADVEGDRELMTALTLEKVRA